MEKKQEKRWSQFSFELSYSRNFEFSCFYFYTA